MAGPGAHTEEGVNVLLETSGDAEQTARACSELLETDTDEPGRRVVVSVEASADEWLTAHQQSDHSGELVVITLGDGIRSTATTTVSTATVPSSSGGPVIDGIADPSDLTALGIKLHGYLTDTQEPTTLCFDSISGLIHATDTERVFRFLNILTSLVTRNGLRAHYHLDPRQHDPETTTTLSELFDETHTA